MRQSELGQIGQRTAAEIDGERNAGIVAELCEIGFRYFGGEPFDHVIAGMHLHDHAGVRADGTGEIFQMCAVGGADLDQRTARLRHDVRHPERAADLDQLAA